MIITKTIRFYDPLVIPPTELEKLYEFLKSFIDNIIIFAFSIEGSMREFSSLQELLQYENTPKRELRSIIFNARSNDYKTKIAINFSKYPNNVSVEFTGEEAMADALREYLEERLSAMKPWYAFLAKGNMLGSLIPIILQTILFIVLILPFRRFFDPNQFILTPFRFVVVVFVISSVFHFFLNRMRNKYFPVSVFLIGQGMMRHRNNEKIRTVIIVSFFVSIIGSIFIEIGK
jgi:hypothetical protein